MRAYLSIGTNLGDRAANLREAIARLDRLDGCDLGAVSQIYETEPVGDIEQPPFLNLAAEIETDVDPLELLAGLKETEREMGRVSSARWGPRLVDIDIVLYGNRVVETAALTVPHPRFRDRAFVLLPLAEIGPHTIDPITGLTVEQLVSICPDRSWVRLYEPAHSST
jgi:2-amino-4-hydroxy-6-hydroxymethyldihydropteridine diphosphokinase